ncbi:hypothetical protein CEP88_06815 [Roseobacter denitrificans]|nr:hypothetical protein CEP88_06815 [Roseobacter denitrificans]
MAATGIVAPAANSRFPPLGAESKTDCLHCSGAAFQIEQKGNLCKQKAPKLTQNDESSSLARQKCQLSLDNCRFSPDVTKGVFGCGLFLSLTGLDF